MNRLIKFMGDIRTRDVLQIDATVLAGLLILLTVQSYSEPTLIQYYDINRQQSFELDIQNTSISKSLEKLYEKANNIPKNQTERLELIQNQIVQTELELIKISSELETRTDAKKYQEIAINFIDYSLTPKMVFQAFAVFMITPFVGSALWEILTSFEKKEENKQTATKGAKIWMMIGFVFILIGLIGINQFVLLGGA